MAGHTPLDHGGDKRTAPLIPVFALCLALVETGANSARTEVFTRDVEAANPWSFFQARTIRQTTVRTAVEEVELDRRGEADGAVRAAIEARQKARRDAAARWGSEPDTGEDRRELSERARAAEATRERDTARGTTCTSARPPPSRSRSSWRRPPSSSASGCWRERACCSGSVGLALGALGRLAPGAVRFRRGGRGTGTGARPARSSRHFGDA